MTEKTIMLNASGKRLGNAWLCLTACFILHVADEAIHRFLDLYLENVFAIQAKYPNLPVIVFTDSSWIAFHVIIVAALLLLVPFAYRELGPIRIYAKVFAAIMFVNGLFHLLGSTILHRMLPGVYSSPLLLLFSFLLFRRTLRPSV